MEKETKMFTQEELDNIVKGRLERNRASVLKELGIEDVDSFMTERDEYRAMKDAQKSDQEKRDEELELLRKENADFKDKISKRELNDAAISILKELVDAKRYKAVIKLADMSEQELQNRLSWNKAAKVGSGVLIVTGFSAVAVGSYYGLRYGYITAVGLLSGATESPLGAFLTYLTAAGSIGGFSLAVMGYAAIKFSLDAINELNFNKHLIEVELKQYRATSYKDHPGIGIGISFSLN